MAKFVLRKSGGGSYLRSGADWLRSVEGNAQSTTSVAGAATSTISVSSSVTSTHTVSD